MEEGDVTETSTGHKRVYARLEFVRRSCSSDVLELSGKERAPIWVAPVETNASAFKQPNALFDHIAGDRRLK
jgi:hypothetical protein